MNFGNFGNLYNPPPRGQVWKTLDDLLIVLDQYRKWYSEGRSDVEISALIKTKYVYPHNPQSQFRRGKR